jgi:rubrerythrin
MNPGDVPKPDGGDNHHRNKIPDRIVKRLSQAPTDIPPDDFETVKQVLNFAIAREKESYDAYFELAKLITEPEVRSMFEEFAADELQHALRLEAIEAGDLKIDIEKIGSLGIAENLQSRKITADMDYVDALAAAIIKEQNAYNLYTLLASKVDKQVIKEIFLHIAREEAKHKLKLEVEYDLVTF